MPCEKMVVFADLLRPAVARDASSRHVPRYSTDYFVVRRFTCSLSTVCKQSTRLNKLYVTFLRHDHVLNIVV